MSKLVVLKLGDGSFEQGFPATLQIGEDGERPFTEITGRLPSAPDLPQHYTSWRLAYRRLGLRSRLEAKAGVVTNVSKIEDCGNAGKVLRDRLNVWLYSESFRSIREKLLEQLMPSDEVRVLIQTEDIHLARLPWHLCDWCERYPKAEIALSAPVYERVEQLSPPRAKARILAILGNSAGIDIQADRILLEQLPDAEITFLVEPEHQELNEHLWKQGWDILFFAGHSSSQENGETGRIYINQTDSLTIDQLKYGLKKAVERGLKIAIFNSCDGLGLAQDLASLHIPQIVVMREPVSDKVAQEFLKAFLEAFARGESFYLAVREARERLQGLEAKFPCATWLPIICQNPAVVPPTWQGLCGRVKRDSSKSYSSGTYTEYEQAISFQDGSLTPTQKQSDRAFVLNMRSLRTVFLASLAILLLIMGVRHLGMLQTWELQAFDHLMRLRPSEVQDQRLLIVTIDEADIQYQNRMRMNMRWSLSDQALSQLLKKLEQYQPRAIGIDIYRDFPVDPNYADLATRLQQDNRLFAVCKVAAAEDGAPDGTPPPPEVPEKRLSFSDFVADQDEIARRQLLHLTAPLTSPCAAKYAFSLQLALHYLEAAGIKSEVTPPGYLQIGNVVFKQLKAHTSGYQGVDASGYQVLLNYRSLRSFENIAQQVPLRDVLNDRIKPELVESVKGRIVLIGVTAPSSADYWKTPYSATAQPNQKQIPGVFVQAQMVSHILSAVLDHRPLFWWWPEWVEVLWVWGWSLVGGTLVWCIRQPYHLGLAGVIALGTLFGICFGIFTQAGWVPLVPSALALVATQVAVVWWFTQRPYFGNSKRHLDNDL